MFLFEKRNNQDRKITSFCNIKFWSDKTNDLRIVTKASKFPPAILRKIRGYAAEMDELEETILYIIGEFPNLVGTKVTVEDNERNESREMYWLELALECVADMDKSDLTKEIIEKAVSARLRKKTDVEETKHVSIYALGQQFLEKRDLCKRSVDSYNVMFRVMFRYKVFRSKTTGIEWHWNLNATTKEDMTDFVDYIRHEK